MSIFSNIPSGGAGKSVKEAFDTADNTAQTEILNTVIATNTVLIQRQSNARAETQQANVEADILRREIKRVRGELDEAQRKIRKLKKEIEAAAPREANDLIQTVNELTKENRGLKDSYETRTQMLTDWSIAQRAFKELSMKYGIGRLGKTYEEVMQDFKVEVENVKNNATEYGNDISKVKFT